VAPAIARFRRLSSRASLRETGRGVRFAVSQSDAWFHPRWSTAKPRSDVAVSTAEL